MSNMAVQMNYGEPSRGMPGGLYDRAEYEAVTRPTAQRIRRCASDTVSCRAQSRERTLRFLQRAQLLTSSRAL